MDSDSGYRSSNGSSKHFDSTSVFSSSCASFCSQNATTFNLENTNDLEAKKTNPHVVSSLTSSSRSCIKPGLDQKNLRLSLHGIHDIKDLKSYMSHANIVEREIEKQNQTFLKSNTSVTKSKRLNTGNLIIAVRQKP